MLLIHSKMSFHVLFGVQFLLLIASSLTYNLKLGVLTLLMTLALTAIVIAHSIYKKADWTPSLNGMLLLISFWGLFCFAEIANPNHVQEAWNIMITHYLVYPVICAVLIPITIRNIKDIQWLLIIWSLFVLYAAAKGYWQKNHGFNERELYFLYVLGGARTHFIWSGIRYFSCFTEAANFGVHMAMAIITFGISLFYTKNIGLKIYFAVTVLAAIYGMGLSGTRAAIAVPIGGLGLFIILSGYKKAAVTGLFVLLALFLFFRFTHIGDGNSYIWKMRSAFTPTDDASFQARVTNREQMQKLMIDKPFGYGQGLSKGAYFNPKELMPYPPDSWLVSVWVENGMVGLVVYLLVHAALFAWCSWILLFKTRNQQLRGLLAAWLCMAAGFFIAAYANDVMQYPNSLVVYTAFGLCFAGPAIDKQLSTKEAEEKLTKNT
ncbi:MAG: O-antigen ligase family protein [Bacteroides sp.]